MLLQALKWSFDAQVRKGMHGKGNNFDSLNSVTRMLKSQKSKSWFLRAKSTEIIWESYFCGITENKFSLNWKVIQWKLIKSVHGKPRSIYLLVD